MRETCKLNEPEPGLNISNTANNRARVKSLTSIYRYYNITHRYSKDCRDSVS